ncbi:MAG: rod shape-determining protein RodA, partial [Sinomicrobium sp.]|nr:rod shape-determining protein RodA [Sinomicrobium sp.]
LSLFLILLIFSLSTKLYERFTSIYYLVFVALLAGLFVFGRTISGATSWYALGPFSFQPSEFAKVATALAIAKYLSDIQTDIKQLRYQLGAFAIVGAPALLTLLQPDPGTALTYAAFFFVLYREGLPWGYVFVPFAAAALFIATLVFGVYGVCGGIVFSIAVYVILRKRSHKRVRFLWLVVTLTAAVSFSFSTSYIFDHVLEQRHRDRLSLWLNLEKDSQKIVQMKRTIGYNTHQSEVAVSSGRLLGKGFLEGTLTKGDFVPEQHTDYIFTSVGEEWGFVGGLLVVLLFVLFLFRLFILAERQRSRFGRVYGYGAASLFFVHFFINIGMVIGLLPTVGIPLPFFSYGGSGLLSFTLLLFIFLKLNTDKYIHA